MVRIHPDLERQLAAAMRAGRKAKGARRPSLLEVVVHLKPERGRNIDRPEECRQRAEALLRRVEAITREAPADFNVFANLQSMVVRASAPFVKTLLEQPEVRTAVANRRAT